MDSDGRLGCEEFVLAMHLCDMAKSGDIIPTTLPLELIPPTFRRQRQSSVSSQGVPDNVDPLAGMPQVRILRGLAYFLDYPLTSSSKYPIQPLSFDFSSKRPRSRTREKKTSTKARRNWNDDGKPWRRFSGRNKRSGNEKNGRRLINERK